MLLIECVKVCVCVHAMQAWIHSHECFPVCVFCVCFVCVCMGACMCVHVNVCVHACMRVHLRD